MNEFFYRRRKSKWMAIMMGFVALFAGLFLIAGVYILFINPL